MKKLLLFIAAVAVAFGASAQFELKPANPTDVKWQDFGSSILGQSNLKFKISLKDATFGIPLDAENFSYSIFTDDDQIFTFTVAEYGSIAGITEDMTEIPYGFNKYSMNDSVVFFYRTNQENPPFFTERIGIQVYYNYNGTKTASDIVYTYLEQVNPAKPANATDLTWAAGDGTNWSSLFQFDIIPPVDVDGNTLLQANVSYSIFFDYNERYTFLYSEYGPYDYLGGMTGDMDELPFSLIHGYLAPGAIHFLNDPQFIWRIGVQVYYTVDGVRNSSDIVYLEVNDAPAYLLGDVNANDAVTIADVTVLIDFLLGNPPARYDERAADVNGNGDVSISDMTALIDLLLGS